VRHLGALALALLLAGPARAERAVPPLTGPVVDEAGLLDRNGEARLARLALAARAEHGGNGVQLQFLLVPSLDGEPIESFSIRVAEAWELGSRESDNGILVVVSRDDRAFRIEVGGGLEGELPDALAGRILGESMAPHFREGRYAEGLFAGAVRILSAVNSLPENVAVPPRSPAKFHVSSLAIVAFVLFFLFARIFSGFGGRRRRTLWGLPFLLGGGSRWGGGGGRWGGGGFGGGGGGWSGGGGSFSGGGASGRW
jgi:uncharacterized protein